MYKTQRPGFDRRQFLAKSAALGAVGLLGLNRRAEAIEPPPETTHIRIVHAPFICTAPQYLAEELFPIEGFKSWEYLPVGTRSGIDALANGEADVSMWNSFELLPHLDARRPVVVLAGLHGGCYQLLGNEQVRTIRDLKGKTVAVHYLGSGDHILLSAMLSYVGIDPREVNWVTGQNMFNAMDLFIGGKADAFMGWAQEPAELREKRVGHMIVDIAQDRPWSGYFCCMFVVNRDFFERNPIATKRALRAMLKSADICASDPASVARFLAAKLYEPRYPIGIEVMKSTKFDLWRTVDPADTLRFYALRLHEVGMVKTPPNELIAQGTDWRFLNELKRELKA